MATLLTTPSLASLPTGKSAAEIRKPRQHVAFDTMPYSVCCAYFCTALQSPGYDGPLQFKSLLRAAICLGHYFALSATSDVHLNLVFTCTSVRFEIVPTPIVFATAWFRANPPSPPFELCSLHLALSALPRWSAALHLLANGMNHLLYYEFPD
jgi:hypothetical protein